MNTLRSTATQTAYLAGPMRGFPLYNFGSFDDARDELNRKGWNVISPADLDRAQGFNPHGTFTPDMLRDAIKRDLLAIIDRADAIVVLDGWEKSKGANVEVALGRLLGLPVLDLGLERIDAPKD